MLSIQNAQRTHICGFILSELRERQREKDTNKAHERSRTKSVWSVQLWSINRNCNMQTMQNRKKEEFHLNGTKVNKTQRNDYITPGSQLNTFTFVLIWFDLDFVSCLVLCIVLYALFHVRVCDLVLFAFDDHESFVEAFSTNRAKKKPPCKCAHILSE